MLPIHLELISLKFQTFAKVSSNFYFHPYFKIIVILPKSSQKICKFEYYHFRCVEA
jgi:hypothetical protein